MGSTQPGSARGGRYPARSGWGVPCQGVPRKGNPLARSGWRGTQVGYPPSQDRGYPGRVPPWPGQDGGTQVGYPLAGYPQARMGGTQVGTPQQGTPGPGRGDYPERVPLAGHPPGQVRMGGTQLGNQKEYSLHGGRYASCVHAGGLSCFAIFHESEGCEMSIQDLRDVTRPFLRFVLFSCS